MNAMFKEISFNHCESNWSVHVHKKLPDPNGFAASATSIDDITLITHSKDESSCTVNQIQQHFEVTDNGDVKWLLGC